MIKLQARTPVRTWYDRNGTPVYYERTYEHQWRFPVSLDEISPEVIDVIINTEDRRFWQHNGIDYLSILRAFFQNLFHGNVISGASTISMQIADMEYLNGKRTIGRKIMQLLKARRIEQLHSKEEILEVYLNNLPFGENYYGIETAARQYFGMNSDSITIVEASLLCGLPQRPNAYRPNVNPDAARARQRRVLDGLVKSELYTKEEADEIFTQRLRYRSFSNPAEFWQKSSIEDLSFLINSGAVKSENEQEVRLSIDYGLTERVRDVLVRHTDKLSDVNDAAAFLIDVKKNEPIVYLGTIDFDSPAGGQVDAIKAIRSAGSTLKPFIYYEALCGGIIAPDSILLDAPLYYKDYEPLNFDGSYKGRVSVKNALALSLNTPVIRLLDRVGVERMTGAFNKLGLDTVGQVTDNGLSLALGSAGYRLFDITKAYLELVPGREENKDDICEGARIAVSEILRSNPLPGTALQVAWKTGTSNNNHDAWCIAYTEDYVLGIWVGNKDGKRSESLVGVEVAAPIAGEIMNLLYGKRRLPFWTEGYKHYRITELCSLTGAVASTSCTKIKGRTIDSIPVMQCTACVSVDSRISITSPKPITYYTEENADSLILPLKCNADVAWMINGTVLEKGIKEYNFAVGEHEVVAIPYEVGKASRKVVFSAAKLR